MTAKPYEVIYSLRGDAVPARFAGSFASLDDAKSYCRELRGPLPDSIHYVICHEDGSTQWDTRKSGLIAIEEA